VSEEPFGVNFIGVSPVVEADPASQESFMFEERGMDKCLAGYAAPIDAGAPQYAFLEHQYPRPVACGAQSSCKSGGT